MSEKTSTSNSYEKSRLETEHYFTFSLDGIFFLMIFAMAYNNHLSKLTSFGICWLKLNQINFLIVVSITLSFFHEKRRCFHLQSNNIQIGDYFASSATGAFALAFFLKVRKPAAETLIFCFLPSTTIVVVCILTFHLLQVGLIE